MKDFGKFSANTYDSGILTGKEFVDALHAVAQHITKRLMLDMVSAGSINLQNLMNGTYMLNVAAVIVSSKATRRSTKTKSKGATVKGRGKSSTSKASKSAKGGKLKSKR